MTTTTSFDTPRVFGHHNPFASFSDDPLAQATSNSGFGTSNSGNSTSTDPWSSYYNQPVASTSSNTNSNSVLANVIDEESIPGLYIQAWNAAVTASSNTTTTTSSFGSTFNTGNTISLGVLQKVLSGCAGLGASETEKVCRVPPYCSVSLYSVGADSADHVLAAPICFITGNQPRLWISW